MSGYCKKHKMSYMNFCSNCESLKHLSSLSQADGYVENYDPHALVPGDTTELLKSFSSDSMTRDDHENTLLEQKSARHNTGKINPIELDPQFVMGMAEVLSKSRVKYPEFNWALPTKLSTPYASLFRHLMAFQSGEDVDPEDGCHHMLKVAVNAMFIHYHNVNNKEESDDRFFKKDKK